MSWFTRQFILFCVRFAVSYKVCNVNVSVEQCVNGLPRCPHCSAESTAACNEAAVTKDCQNKDVSHYCKQSAAAQLCTNPIQAVTH